MARYVLAIDQGTTGSTALILDQRISVKAKANVEFRQIFPKPGWVEHDLDDIWTATLKAIVTAMRQASIKPAELQAIGITNQRETTLLWDRHSGRPIHNAIVWQDRRTADLCNQLKAQGKEPWVREKTGLVLDAYFSGTKVRWLLDHVHGAQVRAENGDLCFGTTKGVRGIPDGIPIAGIAGDQQSALVGQACFEEGEAKCTYGTGAFLLMNAGPKKVTSRHGLLGTVGWQIGDEVAYALEGSAFIAGAVVQWLRDGLGLFEKSAEVEKLAASVPDSGGVVFVPALAGLGAPHWRQEARGLICGIDRGVTKAHLARAALEGVAFEINDLAQAMAQDIGKPVPMLRVDGGASANDLLMQFQADLLQTPIERPHMIETTALGAAFLAGLGTGMWAGLKELRSAWRPGKQFKPKMKPDVREAHLARWKSAVQRA